MIQNTDFYYAIILLYLITTLEGVVMFLFFADCSKTFDRVNYWKLFKQLLKLKNEFV